MPIYEYRAADQDKCCDYCRDCFESIHKASEPAVSSCPKCSAPVKKLISKFGVQYGLDFRAKESGMTKLVRRDKGTYEKMY